MLCCWRRHRCMVKVRSIVCDLTETKMDVIMFWEDAQIDTQWKCWVLSVSVVMKMWVFVLLEDAYGSCLWPCGTINQNIMSNFSSVSCSSLLLVLLVVAFNLGWSCHNLFFWFLLIFSLSIAIFMFIFIVYFPCGCSFASCWSLLLLVVAWVGFAHDCSFAL